MENTRAEIENEIREEIRTKQREYKRNWRSKNTEKIKKHNENYIIKKAAELIAQREQEGNQ